MKALYFLSRDEAGCFGCFWFIGTQSEASALGFIQRITELTPSLTAYLQGMGTHGL